MSALLVCFGLGVAALVATHALVGRTADAAQRSEATRMALGWSAYVAKTSTGSDLLAAATGPVPPSLAPLAEAMRAQQIHRMALFDPAGRHLLSTDGVEISKAGLSASPDLIAAKVASAGHSRVELPAKPGRSQLRASLTGVYAPFWQEGRITGVLKFDLEQSIAAAEFQRIATALSLDIALIVFGAIALPLAFIVRKSRRTALAKRDRRMDDARFAAAVETIPQGYVMFDRDANLVACNERYRRMYDLPADLSTPGTPRKKIVKHCLERGILVGANAGAKCDLVADRTWELRDGRIIQFTTSGLADGRRVAIHTDITAQHRAAAMIAESESRFRDFASSAADWFWESDAAHRLTYCSDVFKATTGINVAGKRIDDLAVHPDDADRLRARVEMMQNRLPFRDLVMRMPTSNGGYVTISSNGAPRFARDGTFLGYRGAARNVTRQHGNILRLEAAEQELLKRTQLLEEAQRLGKMGNVTIRTGLPDAQWSAEIYNIMRIAPGTCPMPSRYFRERCLGDSAARLEEALKHIDTPSATQSLDIKVRRDDGTVVDCAVVVKGVFDEGANHIGYRIVVQDISDRTQAVEQLERLAFYDQLTRLPNRAYFTRELDALLACPDAQGAALLLLDLDHFKDVNDTLGHASGDELLSKVSAIIASRLRREDLLARIGGDEFAIIMRSLDDQGDVAARAASIIDAISGSIMLSNGEVAVGTSVGIAFPDGETSALELFRRADLALYKAKEGGRERYEIFRPDMDAALRHKMRLERDLKRAVSEDLGLSAHYQPQVDLRRGRVTGFEALLRWTHPELGQISPAEFIPIAENSRLIVDVGRWILRKATRQMQAWIEAGHEPREISVNVSAAQLWHSDLAADVAQILEEVGLPPHLLCLELTESVLANPSEHRVRSEIERLNDLGVKLALDDFGTDYSSLGYLAQLPFDQLKIDRLFINGVVSSDRRRELLKGIIAIGHGLGMTVVGEGAEQLEEIEVMTLLGCDVAQGYGLCRPLPPEQALAAAGNFEMPARVNDVHALQQQLWSRAG